MISENVAHYKDTKCSRRLMTDCHHFVTYICRSDVYFNRFYSFGPTCSGSGVTEAGLSNTK